MTFLVVDLLSVPGCLWILTMVAAEASEAGGRVTEARPSPWVVVAVVAVMTERGRSRSSSRSRSWSLRSLGTTAGFPVALSR